MAHSLLIAVLFTAGCVSIPPPSPGDAGSDTPKPPGAPFPPGDRTIDITRGIATDLDGDQIDDLVVLSRGSREDGAAFILYGSDGTALTEFHHAIELGDRTPLSVAAAQLAGDDRLDLIVFAVDYNDPQNEFDNDSFVYAAEADPDGSFLDPLINEASRAGEQFTVPRFENEPASIAAATLDDSVVLPGIVVAHDHGLFTLQPTVLEPFEFSALEPQPLAENIHYAELLAVTTPGGMTHDIFAVSPNEGTHWYRNSAGAFTLEPIFTEPNGIRHADLYELDASAPADLIGVNGTTLQAQRLAAPLGDGAPDQSTHLWLGTNNTANFSGAFRDVVVLDVDGDAGPPEIILAAEQCGERGGVPCLAMISNAFIDTDSSLDGTGYYRYFDMDAGFVPHRLFVGDFDGDRMVEILAFAEDGRHACVRPTPAELTACNL